MVLCAGRFWRLFSPYCFSWVVGICNALRSIQTQLLLIFFVELIVERSVATVLIEPRLWLVIAGVLLLVLMENGRFRAMHAPTPAA